MVAQPSGRVVLFIPLPRHFQGRVDGLNRNEVAGRKSQPEGKESRSEEWLYHSIFHFIICAYNVIIFLCMYLFLTLF